MKRYLNFARIDLKALAHNLGQVKNLVGPSVGVMAVIKAEAYGHGLVPAGVCLARAGAEALGVMDLEEAVRLREEGLSLPIYVLAGFAPGHCAEIVARELIPFVYDPGLARDLEAAARKKGRRVKVHLKVDTGMNRLGVPYYRAGEFLEAVQDLAHLEVTGLATHLSEADFKETEFVETQLDRFDETIMRARALGYRLEANNVANSAAVLSLPRANYQLVRPGLMLYGVFPGEHLVGRADLHPVLSVLSEVVQVKRIPAGSPVSYGRTWVAPRETVLATIPLGYTHGYPRRLSDRGSVLIRGRRAPIRGRVCMNLIMVDVTDIPGAAAGDEVVLLGSQEGESITAEALAEAAETISYELLCTLGGLNHREYVGEA